MLELTNYFHSLQVLEMHGKGSGCNFHIFLGHLLRPRSLLVDMIRLYGNLCDTGRSRRHCSGCRLLPAVYIEFEVKFKEPQRFFSA